MMGKKKSKVNIDQLKAPELTQSVFKSSIQTTLFSYEEEKETQYCISLFLIKSTHLIKLNLP